MNDLRTFKSETRNFLYDKFLRSLLVHYLFKFENLIILKKKKKTLSTNAGSNKVFKA